MARSSRFSPEVWGRAVRMVWEHQAKHTSQWAEEIYRRESWKGLEDVEFATLEWVAWYNGSRLVAPLGYVSPAEFEQAYHDRQAAPAAMAVLT